MRFGWFLLENILQGAPKKNRVQLPRLVAECENLIIYKVAIFLFYALCICLSNKEFLVYLKQSNKTTGDIFSASGHFEMLQKRT